MLMVRTYVIKRDGRREDFAVGKIAFRISRIVREQNLNTEYISVNTIIANLSKELPSVITSVDIDKLAIKYAVINNIEHPDYLKLASFIEVSNLHKETKPSFSDVVQDLYLHDTKKAILSKKFYETVMKNAVYLDSLICDEKDYLFNYFGFKILEESFLLKLKDKVVERPQYLFMRVAVSLWQDDLPQIADTYKLLANQYYIHANPTLLSAGTTFQQMCSSFGLAVDDTVEAIFKCMNQMASICTRGGNLGIAVHDVRAKGSSICGDRGISRGIVAIVNLLNNTYSYFLRSIKNYRLGTVTIFLETWHADIYDYIAIKKKSNRKKQHDFCYALWISDLFMQRVQARSTWSLMCPNSCPGLSKCFGPEFDSLYIKYECEGNYVRQIAAFDLYGVIVKTQIECGSPYMLYKDRCNAKNNQRHLGTLKTGSFCGENLQFSSFRDVSACCYASISLIKFVEPDKKSYNFKKLRQVVQKLTRILNRVIDKNQDPLPETKKSNALNRPIGIGVQGLADTLREMHYSYECYQAIDLNTQIFETIYYAALEESCSLAKEHEPYANFKNSLISKGIFQFDLWKITPTELWDWNELRLDIIKYGVRNSLLVAVPPAATTSLLLGNNESFEPYVSNLYKINLYGKEILTIEKRLVYDFIKAGIWTDSIKQQFMQSNGIIRNILGIPLELKKVYATVWEIPSRNLLSMAADRGAFIDQSQAMYAYAGQVLFPVINDIHIQSWSKGLKTGMYKLIKISALELYVKYVGKQRYPNDKNHDPDQRQEINLSDLASFSCMTLPR